LGCFNLSLKGHAQCVDFVKKFNLPLLMLGGGGYTIRNVARCWTYETSIALDCDVPNELPYNDYFEYFGPDFKLHIQPSNMQNQNTPDYLDKIKTRLFENMRMIPHAPGVQMQPIPEDSVHDSDDEEDTNKSVDQRISIRASDKRIANETEYSDSEDEGEGRRNNGTPRKKMKTGSPIGRMVIDEDKDAVKSTNGMKQAEENGNENGDAKDTSMKNDKIEDDRLVISDTPLDLAPIAKPPDGSTEGLPV